MDACEEDMTKTNEKVIPLFKILRIIFNYMNVNIFEDFLFAMFQIIMEWRKCYSKSSIVHQNVLNIANKSRLNS